MIEQNRVDAASNWYLDGQLDFDKQLIRMRYRTIKPYFSGPEGLELGPAEGQMTRFLVSDFKRLTVVEGSEKLLELIPDAPNLTKVHALFEDFIPDREFNTIILEHILEHVESPVDLLRRAGRWICPGGRILAGVPNGNSIHRLAAVKMGLLKHPCELNERDKKQGHRRVYEASTFRSDIEKAGLNIAKMGGVFLKPLSNKQIEDHWSPEMIEGFFKLAEDFPLWAADLYAVCERP